MRNIAKLTLPVSPRLLLRELVSWLRPRLGAFFLWGLAGYITGMLLEVLPHVFKGGAR